MREELKYALWRVAAVFAIISAVFAAVLMGGSRD